MKILIKVTKEVLERSKFCKKDKNTTGLNCAIAVAVRDLFPQAMVGYGFISLFNFFDIQPLSQYDRSDYVEMSAEAFEFMRQFDDKKPSQRVDMKPFSFEIEVPEFVIQAIGINTVYKVLSESKTLEHVNPL